ncbi:hypothetical protein [Deinococcus sp. UR1]|uniref:hypothetical protein n=1 Tax=Deinococcus sp. UR1 TaxID=1704277 RepID=UPI000C18EC4E|nr:hypothetical protein [Deinococcus sp. UR1]PIG96872.1 hypothetical protein AMD26_015195 [Deinococcus sp. UR1]
MARPEHSTLALRDARAYIFRVLLNGKPRNYDDIDGMRDGMFILPRHPISVAYQAGARTFTFATGTTTMRADQQGVDPPVIQLSLNFGERGGYDAASRQGMDGRRSMRAVESLIRAYLKAAANAGRARQPIPVLEFHDIYRGESWVVTPQSVPYGMEDAGRPYTEDGSLRLQALERADTTIPPSDPIPARLKDKVNMCPLHPVCKYGGPFESGCPFRGKK